MVLNAGIQGQWARDWWGPSCCIIPWWKATHGGERARQQKPDCVPLSPLFNINPYMRQGASWPKHPGPTSQYCCTRGETLNHNISWSYQVLTTYQMLSQVPLHPLNTGSHYCLRDERRSRRLSIFPFFTASELPLLGWGGNQADRLHPDLISEGLHWQPVLKSLRLLRDGLDSAPRVFN